MRLMKLKQNGDTIVEVLIATVVISAVLVGAYAVSNKSFLAQRQSNERGQGLQLLEDQFETLRGGSFAGDPKIIPGNSFCIEVTAFQPIVGASANRCNFNADNSLNVTKTEPDFHIAITEAIPGPTQAPYTFNGTVTWDQVGGGSEIVNLTYRVYP